MCGEQLIDMPIALPVLGIIPACAGNSLPELASTLRSRDHPRVCGEQRGGNHRNTIGMGSSPRVRGTVVDSIASTPDVGIIPACAGNSGGVLTISGSVEDHPRVCGEQPVCGLVTIITVGSSPRVRGTAGGSRIKRTQCGIIPACAGNSLFSFLNH